MGDELSRRQKINVELAVRAANKKSSRLLKHHIPPEEQENLKIDFICECSDPACEARISLTLKEYEKLHSDVARFVIAKGHTEPQVEKVHHETPNSTVVEKYAL